MSTLAMYPMHRPLVKKAPRFFPERGDGAGWLLVKMLVAFDAALIALLVWEVLGRV